MRPVPLTVLQGGINRLRVKGAASSHTLYDLTNAYITNAGSVAPREGTIRAATLNSSSVGLCCVDGQFNVFATSLISVPSGYICNVLVNPNNSADTLKKIWFAKPFMGFLYVVAQFTSGAIYHYWLQNNGTWTANTVYQTGNIVLPPSATGLAYQAVRDVPPNSVWQPNVSISAGTIVEPTDATGYMYKAVAVAGTTPHTGSTEPSWPVTSGGIIQEFGDFDTNSNDTGTITSSSASSTQALGANLTDRYGDSSTIANTGTGATSSLTSSTLASTTVTVWAPGTTYAPGSVVQPSTNQGAFINAIPNGDFEAGNDGNWTFSSSTVTISTLDPYQGTHALQLGSPTAGPVNLAGTMTSYGTVTPGQSVTITGYLNPNCNAADASMTLNICWYNSSDTLISTTKSALAGGVGYRQVTVTGNAPASAAHARAQVQYNIFIGQTQVGLADLISWNLETPAAVSNFLYEAVQSAAAASGATEPTWPTSSGGTVVDGGVTWKAIGTSIITWEAIPIMLSGSSAPSFPTTVGLSVSDPSTYADKNGVSINTSMSWLAISRQILDTNCPNTLPVCIGASHVFAGNVDITSYSAAVNPTDWTTTSNAGYLPTGLNIYGDNPVAVLALYRSNLMVFNASGYQMWQIDPDPQNMALLDAQPIGSVWTQAAQSVANNLLLLTEVGVRDISTVGATANMQMGSLGQPVDSLVTKQLRAGTYYPISLYYPGRGQYWLIFGPQAFVLTINGAGIKSWSRYIFPDSITDWALDGEVLYLRTAGNLVWQFDFATTADDSGGSNTAFSSTIQWPYLDMGAFGINKMLVGVDLVGYGSCTIQIGFNQQDLSSFSDQTGFSTSSSVTAVYTVSASDTVPGEPLPIPINAPSYSLILTWASNQSGLGAPNSASWEWDAANIYLDDQRGGGATG